MSSHRTTTNDDGDDMLAEYNFSQRVRGKHAAAYQKGYSMIVHRTDGTTEMREMALPAGVVVLDPDVRAYFPDSETVNRILRDLIRLVPQRPAEDARRSLLAAKASQPAPPAYDGGMIGGPVR